MFTKHKSIIIGAALCAISFGSFAQDNQANIRQNGSGNSNTVQQTGMNEKLTLIQGTNGNTAVQAKADIVMEGNANEVYIKQVGFTHEATVATAGVNNQIKIDQQGSANMATAEISITLRLPTVSLILSRTEKPMRLMLLSREGKATRLRSNKLRPATLQRFASIIRRTTPFLLFRTGVIT